MPQASILLAEPDPGVADLLAEMLAEMGHRPRQAGEDDPGREAEASPDLVIVGVGAEGPDGALVRAGRLLRGGEVPLLWLAEPEDLARLRKHPRWGDAAGLAKPFSQHDLQAAVSLALFRGELQGRLRRSEAQFRTLAENSPDIILRLDEDLDLLYANPAAARLWGWPAEQVEDLAWEELVLPPPLEHFLPARQRRVLASGEPLREQVSVRGPRGTVILDWQMIPEPGPGGAVASVLHSARDITELKAAEADLHRKEARLAHALEATSDGMWEWDLVTSEVYFSPRYLEMIGFKPGELREVHQTWVGLIHPDDRQRVIDHVGRHIRNLSSGFNIEFRFKTKGGPYIWVMARGKVIQRDDQGQALRLIGTHVDITRSKEVEAALRQSEAMWSKVFQRSPVWITIATLREGRILEVNDAFCRISGFSRSEAVGRTVDELGLWPDPELRDDYIALVKEQGAFTEKEVQFKVRDGSLRTLLWSCESMELGGITCTTASSPTSPRYAAPRSPSGRARRSIAASWRPPARASG